MCKSVRVCVFKSLQEYWALPRLSGTVSTSSVKDTIRQGVKGRGGEEWMVGSGGLCWRGRKATRLRKSEKSAMEVLDTETKSKEMHWIQKFLF